MSLNECIICFRECKNYMTPCKYIKFINKSKSVVIKKVYKNTIAKLGLTKGMIITHVNNVPLFSTTQLNNILDHEKNISKQVVFSVKKPKQEKKKRNLLSRWF